MEKTIVCFGDSNTYGFDTKTGGRFPRQIRWTGVLAEALGEEYEIEEEGLCGRTCVFDDPMSEGMNGLNAVGPCLRTHSPVDLLVVSLGTNDTKQRFGATPENIAKGLIRLLEKAVQTPAWGERGPKILVVCPAPIESCYRELTFSGEMGEGCDRKSMALSPLYRSAADSLGLDFLDAGSLVKMGELDGMHLDSEGHKTLGLAIAEKVREILRE